MNEEKEPLSANIRKDTDNLIEQIKVDKNLSSKGQAIDYLGDFYDGKILNVASPESCKECALYGGFFAGKVLCVLKLENKQPLIKYRSLAEAQACSMTSTLITLERKDELMNDLKNVNNREQYWKNQCDKIKEHDGIEIEKLKRPMQELITEKNILNSRCTGLQNGLLESEEKIQTLETDNEYLRCQISKLSENEILKENDNLHIRLAEKDKTLDSRRIEIEKLEALHTIDKQRQDQITSQFRKLLGDLEQFAPSKLPINCEMCVSSFDVSSFVKSMQKAIENLKGYLSTMNDEKILT
jgi:chromosome segregation ATPase